MQKMKKQTIKCTICGIKTKDHHPNTLKCRECFNKIRRTEAVRARDRARNKHPDRLEFDRLRSEERRRDPTTYNIRRARMQTNNLIRSGKLKRAMHCEECGKECKTWANQNGNTNPENVKWLCPVCNNADNRRRNNLINNK